MIRLAFAVPAFAVLAVAAAASPALAFSTQQGPAPHDSSRAHFGMGAVEHLAPSGVSSKTLRDPAKPTDAKMVVYELPAGKPGERIDVNDPKDNPFLAR